MDPALPKVESTTRGMGAIVTVTNASEILHDLSYQWDLVDIRIDVIIIFTTVAVIATLLCIKNMVHEGPGPVLLRPAPRDRREIGFKCSRSREPRERPAYVSGNAAEPPACGARTLEEKRCQALLHTANWILNSPRERALSLYSGTTPQRAAGGFVEIDLDEPRPTSPCTFSV